jgi:tRNA-splicing ligase RtcB
VPIKMPLGIIPGSMGAKSFIGRSSATWSRSTAAHTVRGVMSRHQAEREAKLAEHIADTAGVDCRKDEGVIDESSRAYKTI